MPTKPSTKSIKPKADAKIRFSATVHRPVSPPNADWNFLTLPKSASAKLPSRSMVSVQGTFNGAAFVATLEPDGQGGHWMKIDAKLRESLRKSGVELPSVGEKTTLEVAPLPPELEPEPEVPDDLRKALAAASSRAKEVWADITPIARRDWIHWIISAKQAQTRARRIDTACDMLDNGKRRPCCFDRSGMYGKSMSCPVADAADES